MEKDIQSVLPRQVISQGEFKGLAPLISQERFINRTRAYSHKNPRAKFFFAGLGVASFLYASIKAAKARKNVADTEQRKILMA